MCHPWFFGDISKEEAENFLISNREEPSFLVRCVLRGDDIEKYPFFISIMSKKKNHTSTYP